MSTIHFTDSQGQTREIPANVGDSVMETAVKNGVPEIVAECGGSLSCATCHVYVSEKDLDQLPEMSEMEDEMLYGTSEDRADNSRLSCQIPVTEDMDLSVTTPETQT